MASPKQYAILKQKYSDEEISKMTDSEAYKAVAELNKGKIEAADRVYNNDYKENLQKPLTNENKNVKLQSSLNVKIEGAGYFNLPKGSNIEKVFSFAGKGSDTELRAATHFAELYGNKPEDWSHKRGETYIDFNGDNKKAEVHWFESDQTGPKRMKVKRWLK